MKKKYYILFLWGMARYPAPPYATRFLRLDLAGFRGIGKNVQNKQFVPEGEPDGVLAYAERHKLVIAKRAYKKRTFRKKVLFINDYP